MRHVRHTPVVFQPLEQRTLLSAGVTPGGIAWSYDPATNTGAVNGTDAGEWIIVQRSTTTGNVLIMQRNGVATVTTETLIPTGSSLTLQINAGGGNDNIINRLKGTTAWGPPQVMLAEIHGGAGDDQLMAGDGSNTLWGDDGNDWISNSQFFSNTTAYGGVGNDHMDFKRGKGVFDGGIGDDIITVWSKPDAGSSFRGGEGNDTLISQNGAGGELYGDAGNDIFMIYKSLWSNIPDGAGVFSGGDGTDTFQYYGYSSYQAVTTKPADGVLGEKAFGYPYKGIGTNWVQPLGI